MEDYIDIYKYKAYDETDFIKQFYNALGDDVLDNHSTDELLRAGEKILICLHKDSVDELIDIVDDDSNVLGLIHPSNIPQYSNLKDVDKVLPIVESNAEFNCDYCLIGYFFNKFSKKGAQTKYGENHYKVAMLMGLAKQKKPLDITPLGSVYMNLDDEIRMDVKIKLFLRIPLIRYIMVHARTETVNVYNIMSNFLAVKTTKRRKSNVKTLVELLIEKSNFKSIYYKNINWY